MKAAHPRALFNREEDAEDVEITHQGRLLAWLVPASCPRGLRGLFEDQTPGARDEDDLQGTGAT